MCCNKDRTGHGYVLGCSKPPKTFTRTKSDFLKKYRRKRSEVRLEHPLPDAGDFKNTGDFKNI